MTIGDSNDIVSRVKRLIPGRWFSYVAPIRDAVLGGIADGAAWCYSFVGYAQLQSRIATATGPFLDIVAFDYLQRNVQRSTGQTDAAFRSRIQAELLRERVTRAGMVRALTDLTGYAPWIFEPWNTNDAGAWDTGACAWDTAGGWGDTVLPSQTFLIAYRPGLEGIPDVGGWDTDVAAWDGGVTEWTDTNMITGAVTDQDILNTINRTRPTGSLVWTAISSTPGFTPSSAVVLFSSDSSELLTSDSNIAEAAH